VAAESEISNLEVMSGIEKDIVKFDVPMCNAAPMKEIECLDKLEEETLDFGRVKTPLLS
jgi:hypothetical protein